MNPFKELAILIGGLTGLLAGIGAILYTFGYLVTRAQLNLLGLSGLFEYPNEHFICAIGRVPGRGCVSSRRTSEEGPYVKLPGPASWIPLFVLTTLYALRSEATTDQGRPFSGSYRPSRPLPGAGPYL